MNNNLDIHNNKNKNYKVLALMSSLAIMLLHLEDVINKSNKYNNFELTVVEYDHKRASAIEYVFPTAKVIETDAYEWVQRPHVDLNEYDLIIASPSCISHSKMQRIKGYVELPDFRLYSLICGLQFKTKNTVWIVENVYSHYVGGILHHFSAGRHRFWSNAIIDSVEENENGNIRYRNIIDYENHFQLSEDQRQLIKKACRSNQLDRRQIYRDSLNPVVMNKFISQILDPTFRKIKLNLEINVEFGSDRFYSSSGCDILLKQYFPNFMEIENLTTRKKLLIPMILLHFWMIAKLRYPNIDSLENLRNKVNEIMEADENGITYQRIMNAPHSVLNHTADHMLSIFNIETEQQLKEVVT